MEQRQSTARRGMASARALVGLAALLPASCGPTPRPPGVAGASCLPAPLAPHPRPARGYHLYLDRSVSMSGYVEPALGSVVLPDILALLGSAAGTRRLPVAYSAFGSRIAPLADAAAAQAFASPATYRCNGTAPCDNQQSLIDQALANIAADSGDRLSVVVTDLWLDNKSFRGALEVALGVPLRKLLDDGKAVGVLGIDSPYSGPVYDVPQVGRYEGATRRPLFVLLIGAVDEVTQAYAQLSSGSPQMRGDRARFALFTAAPLALAQTPLLRVAGGGVAQGAAFGGKERAPEFTMSVATAAAQRGAVSGTVAATPDGGAELRPGLQWHGDLRAVSHWWRLADDADLKSCRSGMWQPAARGPSPWKRVPGNSAAAAFSLDADARNSLSVPGRFFMLGELSVAGLYPNPAAAWMEEWSIDDDTAPAFTARHPTQFKALKLANIAALMNQHLASLERRPRSVVRFPLVLTMQP